MYNPPTRHRWGNQGTYVHPHTLGSRRRGWGYIALGATLLVLGTVAALGLERYLQGGF